MTRKVYRTAQGKTVDIGALQLQNENVRAVGNMPVNARGDLLDANGRRIDTRNQQVSRQYQKQTSTNVTDDQVFSSKKTQITPDAAVVNVPVPPEDFEDDFVKTQDSDTGLAAAITRAKSIKQ
jgi:hypothetical protein